MAFSKPELPAQRDSKSVQDHETFVKVNVSQLRLNDRQMEQWGTYPIYAAEIVASTERCIAECPEAYERYQVELAAQHAARLGIELMLDLQSK